MFCTWRRGEWICAHLARSLGLSIPEFALLDVPEELADAFGADGNALGSGLVFGSRQEANVQEFAVTRLKRIGAEERRRLLAFDWWVENADRSLTPHGGNPNLLWRVADQRLLVIDHNLAFDPSFDEANFFATHVFRDDADSLVGDLVCRAETSTLLETALGSLDDAVSSLPPAWHWVDVAQTIPVPVDWKAIGTRLAVRTGLGRGLLR